ncbi:YdcF family protein [Parasediminibacterium sp. JCM 36343]|uniref:YdcF family protein n=1 Tax=Parasediminibacterium sp. JCM 36343 TaxID=3374279 RepID=UPI00397C3D84
MAVVAIVFSNPFLQNEAELAWQVNKSGLEQGKQYEAGILLGGMAGYDKHNVAHFSGAADRFIEVNKLYHQGIIKRIIVSSGTARLQQDEPGEADFLADVLLKSDVPALAIFIENKSRNTFENASFSKRILDSLQLKGPFVLVSSAMHLPRALLVFKKAGLPVVAYPSAFNATEKKYNWTDYVWPSIGTIYAWAGLIREMVGVAMYKLTGKA